MFLSDSLKPITCIPFMVTVPAITDPNALSPPAKEPTQAKYSLPSASVKILNEAN